MKNLRIIMLVGLFTLVNSLSFGQSTLEIANELYAQSKYVQAIESYMDYLVVNTEDYQTTAKLADCYVQTDELYKAAALYAELTERDGCAPEWYKEYGDLMKKFMRFESSKKAYKLYGMTHPSQAKHLIAGCDFAEMLLEQDARCNLENLEYNSKSADFNPQFHNDQLVYTSNRAELQRGWVTKGEVDTEQPKGMSLYAVGDGTLEPFDLKNMLAAENELEAQSNLAEGKKVAFTKNNGRVDARVVASDKAHLQIFLSQYNAASKRWEEKPFPFNGDNFSVGFPYLNEAGDVLYFASNMPGGLGEYDIYVSKYRDGEWKRPINMGNSINTEGNEITPYVKDNTLFFASDWHHGMGGYDVFKIKKSEDHWAQIENLGSCVNSPNDDYGFVMASNDDNKAYFTSNRMGGKGAEDIYSISEVDDLSTRVVQQHIQEPQIPESIAMNNEVSTMNPSQIQLKGVEIKLEIEKDYMILDDAGLAAVELEPNQKVYFVQIAALSKLKGNLNRFSHFRRYGNVYKVQSGSMIKIRIGFFTTTKEAIRVVRELKRKGIREAFIVGDYLDKARLELIAMASEPNMETTDEVYYNPKYNSKYKVRVVSYQYPSKFNTADIADLGRIEHWTKREWRIILLSGFRTLEDANSALIKLKNRGYEDAYVVKDENGQLKSLND